ncbi:MAG: glycosyltransferase [Rhodoferax sp.]|uniref:glycosyltransferase n=1 Tax=Rhodoferax sp. TaxID=50421 RepID=UPI003019D4B1
MEGNKVNLLFIVNSLGVGGAEKHVVTLVNNLDVSRFKLSLAYLKDESELLQQLDRDRIDGREFCCHVSKKIDMQAVQKLASHIRENVIDVIVCTNAFSLLYGWMARILSGHRPRLAVVFHTTELGSMKDRLQMLFYRPIFWTSDMLVYVCENQKKHWRTRALWARHATVIHNGIDVDFFHDKYSNEAKISLRKIYGFSGNDYVIGICAFLRPEKAHSDLLQAIAILRNNGENVKCLIIGDGPQRSEIEDKIGRLGLKQHVSITGLLNDVRPAIAACSVMALVSHNVETFSIAALESMALGKAMVMTEIGGASEQISHEINGYLYMRGDITALAKALHQLMELEHRTTIGTRARSKVANHFSLSGMVQSYDRLFLRMAKDHA